MSRQLKMLVLTGVASLVLSLPAFSQTTTVEGDVKGPDGKPVAGAVIQFDRTDIKGSYTVKTDKKGHYGHYGLPASATFEVSVIVDGQVRDVMKGVKGKVEEDTTDLDFDLKDRSSGGRRSDCCCRNRVCRRKTRRKAG